MNTYFSRILLSIPALIASAVVTRFLFVIPLLIVTAGVCRAQLGNPFDIDTTDSRHGIERAEIVRLRISAVTVYGNETMTSRTEYDTSGRVRFEVSHEIATEYRRDTLGRIVLVIRRGEMEFVGEDPHRMQISYDDEGKMSEIVDVDENGVESMPGARVSYRYHGDTVIVIRREQWRAVDELFDSAPLGEIEQSFDTTVIIQRNDEEGRPFEVAVIWQDDLVYRTLTEYDGCRSVENTTLMHGGIWHAIVDSCARTSELLLEASDSNGAKIATVVERRTFDEAMRPLRVESYDEGRVVRLQINSYDENGLPASFRTQSFMKHRGAKEPVEEPETIERYEYEYRSPAPSAGAKIR